MPSYLIRQCEKSDYDGIWEINKESNLFATAQYITSPMTIEKTVKNKKKLFLVAEDTDTHKCIGYILGKNRCKGVFYNELLGVNKEHRRRGVGGALIFALLKLIEQEKINEMNNKFYAWKWNAEVPAYNFEALQLYKKLNFIIEGILRRHTSAKTDLYMMSFFLDERKIPQYGMHVSNPAEIDDKPIMKYLEAKLRDSLTQTTLRKNSKSSVNYWLGDNK